MLERLERILPPLVIIGVIAEVASLCIQIAQYANPPQVKPLPTPTVAAETQRK